MYESSEYFGRLLYSIFGGNASATLPLYHFSYQLVSYLLVRYSLSFRGVVAMPAPDESAAPAPEGQGSDSGALNRRPSGICFDGGGVNDVIRLTCKLL